MPVSLDEMMDTVPSARRTEIEQNASALVSDIRSGDRMLNSERVDARASTRAAVGMKAMTGQRCPVSGIWKVENTASVTAPVAIDNVMPPYDTRAVTWVLIQAG